MGAGLTAWNQPFHRLCSQGRDLCEVFNPEFKAATPSRQVRLSGTAVMKQHSQLCPVHAPTLSAVLSIMLCAFRCVVCGHQGEYLRHSIAPHCYRQHFPQAMKSHLSHDIVLLCVGCHQICNILDQKKMVVGVCNPCIVPGSGSRSGCAAALCCSGAA